LLEDPAVPNDSRGSNLGRTPKCCLGAPANVASAGDKYDVEDAVVLLADVGGGSSCGYLPPLDPPSAVGGAAGDENCAGIGGISRGPSEQCGSGSGRTLSAALNPKPI
jgi:hypothetical protein